MHFFKNTFDFVYDQYIRSRAFCQPKEGVNLNDNSLILLERNGALYVHIVIEAVPLCKFVSEGFTERNAYNTAIRILSRIYDLL